MFLFLLACVVCVLIKKKCCLWLCNPRSWRSQTFEENQTAKNGTSVVQVDQVRHCRSIWAFLLQLHLNRLVQSSSSSFNLCKSYHLYLVLLIVLMDFFFSSHQWPKCVSFPDWSNGFHLWGLASLTDKEIGYVIKERPNLCGVNVLFNLEIFNA